MDLNLNIVWEQHPDRDSWIGHLGSHCIGHVFKFTSTSGIDDRWQYRVRDLRSTARCHGANKSRSKAKRAVEKAVRQWFVEAGLLDGEKA